MVERDSLKEVFEVMDKFSGIVGRGALLRNERIAPTKQGLKVQTAEIAAWVEVASHLNGSSVALRPDQLAQLEFLRQELTSKAVDIAARLADPDYED